ncbi:MAG: hypothetical protein EZS28_018065, partial [Streblomastix strix]
FFVICLCVNPSILSLGTPQSLKSILIAAISLQKLTEQNLEKIEAMQTQVHAFHIRGSDNIVPDSLSGHTSSGDYSLKDEMIQEVPTQLRVKPTIDIWAEAQDYLSVPQQTETPYSHPPIPLIQTSLQKIESGRVKSDVKVSDTQEKRCRSETRRTYEETQKYLPPEKMKALLKKATRWKNWSDVLYEEEISRNWLSRKLSAAGTAFGQDIDSYQGCSKNATDANQTACDTAIRILFKLQGVPKDKIDGLTQRQITKKPQTAQRKPIKIEPIQHFDELLRQVQSKSSTREQLLEFKYHRITVALIIGYSTLRMVEIHQATAKRMRDGSLKLQILCGRCTTLMWRLP